MGRHSRVSVSARSARGRAHRPPRGMVRFVGARDRLEHLITIDAMAAAQHAGCPYLAICGQTMLPAALVEPGDGHCRQCWAQVSAASAQQRSRRGNHRC
jgi:hypothetical protein